MDTKYINRVIELLITKHRTELMAKPTRVGDPPYEAIRGHTAITEYGPDVYCSTCSAINAAEYQAGCIASGFEDKETLDKFDVLGLEQAMYEGAHDL